MCFSHKWGWIFRTVSGNSRSFPFSSLVCAPFPCVNEEGWSWRAVAVTRKTRVLLKRMLCAFFPPVNDPSSRPSCSRDFIRARRSTYTISDVVVEYAGSFLCCFLHLGKSHELSPGKAEYFCCSWQAESIGLGGLKANKVIYIYKTGI